MPNLTAFLLARITEDEQVASRLSAEGIAIKGGRVLREPYVAGEFVGDSSPYLTDSWNPARVLAECKAKRRIIDIHTGALRALSMVEETDNGSPDAALAIGLLKATAATSEAAVKSLANVYADHPEFDPSWRVE